MKSCQIRFQIHPQRPKSDQSNPGGYPEYYYTNGSLRFIVMIDKSPRASPEIVMNNTGYQNLFFNDTDFSPLKLEMRNRFIFLHDETIDLPIHSLAPRDTEIAGVSVPEPTWFSSRTITKRYLFEENVLPQMIFKDQTSGSVIHNNIFIMFHTSTCDRVNIRGTIEYTW